MSFPAFAPSGREWFPILFSWDADTVRRRDQRGADDDTNVEGAIHVSGTHVLTSSTSSRRGRRSRRPQPICWKSVEWYGDTDPGPGSPFGYQPCQIDALRRAAQDVLADDADDFDHVTWLVSLAECVRAYDDDGCYLILDHRDGEITVEDYVRRRFGFGSFTGRGTTAPFASALTDSRPRSPSNSESPR